MAYSGKTIVLKCVMALAVSFLCACSEPNDDSSVFVAESRVSPSITSSKCRVESFWIVGLYFDEIKNLSVTATPDFTERLGLNYLNGKISQVVGGLKRYPPGGTTTSTEFYWTNDYLEDIVYNGNMITVNSIGMYSKTFVIDNGKIKSQSTTYSTAFQYNDIVNYSPGLHMYEYAGNTILEKKNGVIRRIFYMEDGNLAKVELFIRNATGDIVKKIEYLLTQYDTAPNLLKGKFFINGNFFNAFSKNMFRKREVKYYNVVDGQYQLDPMQFEISGPFTIPGNMFNQVCN